MDVERILLTLGADVVQIKRLATFCLHGEVVDGGTVDGYQLKN